MAATSTPNERNTKSLRRSAIHRSPPYRSSIRKGAMELQHITYSGRQIPKPEVRPVLLLQMIQPSRLAHVHPTVRSL